MGFKLRLSSALIAAAALAGGSAVAVTAPASAAPTGWPVVKLYAPQLHQKIAVYGAGKASSTRPSTSSRAVRPCSSTCNARASPTR